jgi:hypothetical protein
VAALLHGLGYRLLAPGAGRELGCPSDRRAQFEHLTAQVLAFQRRLQPVVALDVRRKLAFEAFKNRVGSDGDPVEESQPGDERAVSGLPRKDGWASVGIDRDTALLAAETIRRWWREIGWSAYPEARELLVAADSGNRKQGRPWLWQLAVQDLADDLGLSIAVCHWPAGISKWTSIQRKSCALTQDWLGQSKCSRSILVSLIDQTMGRNGVVRPVASVPHFPANGSKVREARGEALNLRHDRFHGEWNYTILPRS